MNNNILLISFFRDLINELEENSISEPKLRDLSEFMMRYRFEYNGPTTNDREDFMKFLTMGWHVYTNICKDEK